MPLFVSAGFTEETKARRLQTLKKNQTTYSKETWTSRSIDALYMFTFNFKAQRERQRKRERERERERETETEGERERGGGALPKDISKSELSFLSVSSSFLFLRMFWSPLESHSQWLILIYSGSIPHHLLLPFQCPSSIFFLFSSILRLCCCQLEGFSLSRLRPLTCFLFFCYFNKIVERERGGGDTQIRVWFSTPVPIGSEPPVGIEMPIFEVGVDGREKREKFEICRRDRKSSSVERFATVAHVKTWRLFVVKWWSQRPTSSRGQPTRKMKPTNWIQDNQGLSMFIAKRDRSTGKIFQRLCLFRVFVFFALVARALHQASRRHFDSVTFHSREYSSP